MTPQDDYGHIARYRNPQFVYHSIRKTVVTIMENAGVPENYVTDIVATKRLP